MIFNRQSAIRQLKAKDPQKRLKAIQYLSFRNDRDLWNLMIMIQGDPDFSVQMALIEVLGKKFGIQALVHILPKLSDENQWVRETAVDTIAKVGQSATPALVEMLGSKATLTARIHAMQALGKIGGPEARDVLLRLLDDKDIDVHWAAADALEKNYLVMNAVNQLWEKYLRGPNQPVVGYLLAQVRDPAVIQNLQNDFSLIRVHLSDNRPAQRAAAVKALDAIGGEGAVELILQMVSDPDEQVILAVGKALAKRGDPTKMQSNWSEWISKNQGKMITDEEAVHALVSMRAALKSDELLSHVQASADNQPDTIRAKLEAQLNTLIDRYAPDTFGG